MTPQPSEQPRTRFYRTRVLSLLRHDSECTDGQWCVCKAGQALMDLIAAERAEAAASAPVASPTDRSLIRAAISNADRKVRTWATQQELRQMTPAERTEYVRVRTALAIAALPQDKRDALSIDSDAAIEAEAAAPDPVASPPTVDALSDHDLYMLHVAVTKEQQRRYAAARLEGQPVAGEPS